MKLADHLSKEQIRLFNQLRKANRAADEKKQPKKKHKPKKAKKEKLSQRDLEDLMGKHRDTYKRGPGGAMRRR